MKNNRDLTRADEHFAFGRNWSDFVDSQVTEDRIQEATRGLERLLSRSDVAGRSFFDIGCGSGMSMLAALNLGAARVDGIDLDVDSVAAASRLLTRYAPGKAWTVSSKSVFDLGESGPLADIVYSWGVLHHTGDMWRAISCAANRVAADGFLVLALYRKSALCPVWRVEKRIYARSPAWVQSAARVAYKALYGAGLLATGRLPGGYAAAYQVNRGMSWNHDIHDWMGGFPYESVDPSELGGYASRAGFSISRMYSRKVRALGIYGSHCDEFVLSRLRSTDPLPRASGVD